MMQTSFPTGDNKLRPEQGDLGRIYSAQPVNFSSEAALREWLLAKGVDLLVADSRKGVAKLFQKIEKGEARIVIDEHTHTVFRVARVAKIGVEATIHGERYPLVELCQIFLKNPIDSSALSIQDPTEVAALIARLEIRSAQVRDSQQLWETLIQEEDAALGARRGLIEELRYSPAEAAKAAMSMRAPVIEYEAPIDWPGIPSILEVNEGTAVLPEEVSRAAYVELEAGDQVTIFVATPGAPVVRALLGKIIPNIHYVGPPV